MEWEIRRGTERFVSTYDGVVSRHSFSFGAHYDPANISFGVLVSHNEDTLQPHHGYAAHPHANLEIVTWVLEGSLEHTSSLGEQAVLQPGVAQVLSAGSGIVHAEVAGAEVTRFVQLWITPDELDLPPRVLREQVTPSLEPGRTGDGEWTYVSGIKNSRARVGLARLFQTDAVALPQAQHAHLYVCSGSVLLETGETLVAGDTLRASQCGGLTLTGMGDVLLVSAEAHG